MTSKYVVFYIFSLFLLLHELHSSFAQTWVKAGYWFPASEFPISDINSSLFTHLLCAFADVNPNTYQLNISSSDEPFFTNFTKTVQQKNPSILTLLSIAGGSANSSIYSSMVSQSSYRKAFIDSSIKTARLYGFNGLDLCWVSPSTGSDMINMGTLFDEWRTAIDTESRNSSVSKLILTAAVHYSPVLDSAIFPVESIGRNLDWVHVMAYDYHMPSLENLTGAHAALYDPSSLVSTDYGRGEWIGRGLTAKKLVLALPYYGYAWTLVKPENHGIDAPATGPATGPAISEDGSMRYIDIKDFIRSSGAPSVYNSTMVMNYCYNGSTWIDFDDVEAIATKVEYAKEKGLLGYFVWHVANDDNWVLTQAAQANGTLFVQVNNKDRRNKGRLLVIILVPIITLAMLLLGFLIWYLRRRRVEHKGMKETSPMLREEENDDLELPLFSFSYVTTATNNFSDENKLGEGGFGPVYEGKLLNGQEIAVKRLSRSSGQGLEEFKNEIALIAKLQHVNLVRILGCCIEREEKILIYEYMPNKSLDFYLFDPIKRVLLDSKKLVHIIEGVAQGLLYLHKYSRLKVVHRDLKASNILLDNEMNPKISDFGMARIFRRNENQANTNRVVGTFGYMPPEYVMEGIFSIKSDVFSFGVLVLEIISGKKNTGANGLDESLSLLGYSWTLWSEGKSMEFLDPIILNDASSDFKLMKCIHVALLCVQERAVDRPTMSDVISMLSNETMNLPTPKQPAFSTRQSKNEEGLSTSQVGSSLNDVTMSEIVAR